MFEIPVVKSAIEEWRKEEEGRKRSRMFFLQDILFSLDETSCALLRLES